MITSVLTILTMLAANPEPISYNGFNNATWGSSPDVVRLAVNAANWQQDGGSASEFPPELGVTVFRSSGEVAGYKADVKYYFWNNTFFQATVRFNFDDLKNYDFNYNVFRSVNEYYTAIRSKTLIFTNDIYALLQIKYGKKRPYFKGLDPRSIFVNLDTYLKRESWNLRYHPYDYYLHIVTQAYARWDFPKTRALFSIAISAPDKRFDYSLSCSSLDLATRITTAKDSLRMRGL